MRYGAGFGHAISPAKLNKLLSLPEGQRQGPRSKVRDFQESAIRLTSDERRYLFQLAKSQTRYLGRHEKPLARTKLFIEYIRSARALKIIDTGSLEPNHVRFLLGQADEQYRQDPSKPFLNYFEGAISKARIACEDGFMERSTRHRDTPEARPLRVSAIHGPVPGRA